MPITQPAGGPLPWLNCPDPRSNSTVAPVHVHLEIVGCAGGGPGLAAHPHDGASVLARAAAGGLQLHPRLLPGFGGGGAAGADAVVGRALAAFTAATARLAGEPDADLVEGALRDSAEGHGQRGVSISKAIVHEEGEPVRVALPMQPEVRRDPGRARPVGEVAEVEGEPRHVVRFGGVCSAGAGTVHAGRAFGACAAVQGASAAVIHRATDGADVRTGEGSAGGGGVGRRRLEVRPVPSLVAVALVEAGAAGGRSAVHVGPPVLLLGWGLARAGGDLDGEPNDEEGSEEKRRAGGSGPGATHARLRRRSASRPTIRSAARPVEPRGGPAAAQPPGGATASSSKSSEADHS